ncbi:MAG: ABC transporter ATP-binding protein [Anaerolineae bacterium]|nr:ABC transporter ATP-binding protein [Anaerolineae bacterium]
MQGARGKRQEARGKIQDDPASCIPHPASCTLLKLCKITKSYPDGWQLADVSFCVEHGEIVCLLGPSGCGKTTLLRVIAGLEAPDGGQMLVDGENVTRTPPHLRGFGLMFQEYALFPHKDVFGNVAFGLRMHGLDHKVVAARVSEALALVGLAGFERRDVSQLSGGERQRVALARSLAPHPRLLMLDEPLGALDRNLRERLLDELPQILHQAGATAITVTHDQEEAFAIAGRVVLMHGGRVVQTGTPREVYRRPASAWVAQFLGLTNLLDARVVENGIETEIGKLTIPSLKSQIANRKLLIRPEAAQLGDAGPNVVHGVVTERSFRGERYRLGIRHASGVELAFNIPANVDLPDCGEPITLSLDPQALTILPAEKTSRM